MTIEIKGYDTVLGHHMNSIYAGGLGFNTFGCVHCGVRASSLAARLLPCECLGIKRWWLPILRFLL